MYRTSWLELVAVLLSPLVVDLFVLRIQAKERLTFIHTCTSSGTQRPLVNNMHGPIHITRFEQVEHKA